MKILTTVLLIVLSLSGYSQWIPITREIKAQNVNDSLRARFIITDFQGAVWIGSNQGLSRYSNENLTHHIVLPHVITCAASIDSSFWIGTENGFIFKINPVTLEVSEPLMVADSSAISSIHGSHDKIAISTFGDGVYLLDGNEKLHLSIADVLSDNNVFQAIVENDILICATDRGIDIVDSRTLKLLQNFPSSITTSVTHIDSVIVAASYKYGLVRLNLNDPNQELEKQAIKRYTASKIKKYGDRTFALTEVGIVEISLSDSLTTAPLITQSNIVDFVILREGVLMALRENGNMVMADLRFSKSASETTSNNTALTRNKTQIITGGNGSIKSWNANTGAPINVFQLEDSAVIVSMAASEKDLFIGTFNSGIYKYNFEANTILKIDTTHGLLDNNVLSMSLRNDTLWFTTLSGVSSLSPSGRVTNYSTPKDATYIYSIYANDSSILIGTDGDGLYELKDKKFLRTAFAGYLSGETIYHISEDGNKNLWFITKNQTLIQYNRQADKFAKMDGDHAGYIMASGGYKNSALTVGTGWLKYYVENRLITLENTAEFENLSGEYINNIRFDGDKNIFFASGKSLYRFSPADFNSYPQVVLQSFKTNLNERKLTVSKLDYDIHHIAYSFDAVWYQNPENVRYRYRLIGIDDDWNYSSGNTAVYPNLKYGSYTFEIETGLGNQYYPESMVAHSFTIAKPIYKEWWFILCVILFVLIGIYTGVKWHMRRLNRKWISEKKLIESELAVLRNQVNPHFLFNSLNTLMNLIETKPKAAEDYLQRLSHFYRKILENKDDQVVILSSEIENLEEYIYLQKQRFGEALVLEIELDQQVIRSRIPAMTLQLLAENAIKHNVVSRSQPLTLRIYSTPTHIIVMNKKAPLNTPSVGTGTGIENIQTRYKVLFSKVVVIMDDTIEFIVKLPIIAS